MDIITIITLKETYIHNSFSVGIIRSFVCNTKRPSVKQSMKRQVSSNLADKPTLADVLPPPLPSPPPI